MAIFHMSFSNISAGKGRSAIASAAYRSGEKLFDNQEGRHYFYARSVMPESFILTPKNAPEWASDREKLWNEVENRQARKARSRRLIQKGALLEKYFQADNLSVEQTEELLKIFANYVNAHKPNKFKNDQPNN